MPLDYETLRVIWWLLLGVLLGGFAIFDGFDFGVAMLIPWVANDDLERRVIINTVGPVWEGNQVWLVLGGGAIFAAWPMLYAVSFSGLYLAMMLLLAALIVRPVAFKYRSKEQSATWRNAWDIGLVISGFVPALLFGVAMGNVLLGVPFHFDGDLRSFYTGSFFGLLSPFALICGLTSVAMIVMQGGTYLATKTEGELRKRSSAISRLAAMTALALFVLAGLWVAYGLEGYVLKGQLLHDLPSNPLHKTVVKETGAWMHNYLQWPWLAMVPLLAILSGISVVLLLNMERVKTAFVASSITTGALVATVGVSMFPFILPSSSQPGASLLVWDSSSSHMTLFLMLLATVVFMPLVLAYTAWVYRVLRGPITKQFIKDNDEAVY